MPVQIDIITCPAWGARQPSRPITVVGQAQRIIFHHTAGHHPEISLPQKESRDEAIAYARRIQQLHMGSNGWIDSGHNFLICRNGLILQGRWLTVSAIEAGHMVVSAHCPGQNQQIGVEHEHLGTEAMTPSQRESSARLMAWVADMYGRSHVLAADPHRKYFATSCPANLVRDIPGIVARAQDILRGV